MTASTLVRLALLAGFLLVAPGRSLAEPPAMQVYKSPTCGCCQKWVEHFRAKGWSVAVSNVADTRPVKRELGVPAGLSSCHTAIVDGYYVEGHVPVEDVERLVREKPPVAGLALPGMPIGSPGMEGLRPERYTVLVVAKDGKTSAYATHGP